MSDTRIGLLLSKLPELHALKRHLTDLADLQRLVAASLPGHLSTSVNIASLKGGELILATDNGAVASKLRQIAPRVLNLIRQQGYEITGIEIQVQVRMYDKPLPRNQLLLGANARSAVNSLVERLRASPLKDALKRLASRSSGN
jgi:hypothetical protein